MFSIGVRPMTNRNYTPAFGLLLISLILAVIGMSLAVGLVFNNWYPVATVAFATFLPIVPGRFRQQYMLFIGFIIGAGFFTVLISNSWSITWIPLVLAMFMLANSQEVSKYLVRDHVRALSGFAFLTFAAGGLLTNLELSTIAAFVILAECRLKHVAFGTKFWTVTTKVVLLISLTVAIKASGIWLGWPISYFIALVFRAPLVIRSL